MDVKDAYATQEIMTLLSATTASTVVRRARRESWQSRPRPGRGGGKEWLVSSMPDATRLALVQALPADAVMLPVVVASGAPAVLNVAELKHLPHKDRETVMARLAFVREVGRLSLVGTRGAAIVNLVTASQAGTLPQRLADLIRLANARYGSGEGRGLSRRRLYDWCAAYDERGEAGLIPRNPRKDMTPPVWLGLFMAFYQRPQKPSVAHAYDDFVAVCRELVKGTQVCLPIAIATAEMPQYTQALAEILRPAIPSIHAVRRWIAKISMPECEAGRCTGNALLKLRPHKLRLTDELLPTDVYTADGTTADAEVLHPYTGKPFKPELTFVIDVKTRLVVGVSVALAEDKFTILDALRMACTTGGIPAIFYTDNGPGYKNKLMDAPAIGMMARLGIDSANSIPGRPQGKGLMERAVKTLTERLCKQFASCTHADMDADAGHAVFKLSRKQIKERGTTALMPTWGEFLEALKMRVRQYNTTPHSALPKFIDADGKKRRYSPGEYWQSFVEQGFEAVRVPERLHDELFMPGELRMVRNGWISLYNAQYSAVELADFHGERVEVRYDIWDVSTVHVWTRDGRKICSATIDGNAIPYFPPSQVEASRAKRGRAQITRLEKKIQSIAPGARVELPEVDVPHTVYIADSMARDFVPAEIAHITPEDTEHLREVDYTPADTVLCESLVRPIFTCSADKYEWLMQHREQWTDTDNRWLHTYIIGEEYADFLPIYEQRNIAWTHNYGDAQCVSNL